jgi:hypothetical protein
VTDDVGAEFREAVNMTPGELEKWLATDESKQVGQKSSAGAESVGHDSWRYSLMNWGHDPLKK